MISWEMLLYGLPGLLAAIVLHEFAHAAVATGLGDPTPKAHGRLTLNPLAHIDWIGLLMLFVFRFGWAKPVMVNPYRFADPRRGMLLVALAGPLTNVIIAYICLAILHQFPVGPTLWAVLQLAVLYNVYLAVFNLLPIPPLDGSKILPAIFPGAEEFTYNLEQYGWILLLFLVATGLLGRFLGPLAQWLLNSLDALVRLMT